MSRVFRLPSAPRTPWRYLAAAFVVEAAFVAALIVFRVDHGAAPPGRTLTYLLDMPAAPRQAPDAADEDGDARLRARPLVAPRIVALRTRDAAAAPAAHIALGAGADDSLAGATGRPGRRTLATLGPRYGDGRLWRRPMLIEDFPVGSRPIDMDSVVRQRLLAMADSIERNPSPDPNRPTRWVFERNGRTYGIDEHGNIHLGVITIPGAVLALIPMPQGNIDQARANARLAAMRADLMRAAARAQAEDDFRRAVQQIRERTQRERRERQERERERQGGERPIP